MKLPRQGAMLAALSVIVVIAVVAGVAYTLTRSSDDDESVESELLAPGLYHDIAEANRAAGFSIPHLRDTTAWSIESIDVDDPYDTDMYGNPIAPPPPSDPLSGVRIVAVAYRSESGDRVFRLVSYIEPDSPLLAFRRGSSVANARVAGSDAIIERYTTAAVSEVLVHWQPGEVRIVAHMFNAAEARPRNGLPGPSVDELLMLLESVE